MMTSTRLAAILIAAVGATANAQTIGTEPGNSLYADVVDGQRLSVIGGVIMYGKDPAKVGPKGSSPLAGLRYDVHMGGPAYFTARFLTGHSYRDILDYNQPSATRKVREKPSFLLLTDIGVTVSLTGERTWRGVQPLLFGGVGFALAPGDTRKDVSGYTFGNKFAFSTGLGVRWRTTKNTQFRADLGWYYWAMKYPDTYRSTTADPKAILPTGSLSPYYGSRAITVGYSWGIFR